MLKPRYLLWVSMVLFAGLTFKASAIIGIGAHYGIDLTMKMNDKLMEQTSFDNLKFSLSDLTAWPTGYDSTSVLSGKDIPIYINRTGWKNTGINFGGKIYVDVLPFVDALEISTNFGVWQYNGSVIYPKNISVNSAAVNNGRFTDLVNIDYDTISISMKKLYPNRFFWGVDQTPYAKLHFDATIRKYLLQVPPVVKILKFYGGAGMSIDFATPVLSSNLIQDALGSTLNGSYNMADMGQVFDNTVIMKKILDKIIDNLMTPHYGCHIALGTMVKFPMIPVGFYIDGKYIIRFDKLDKYVDVGGDGFLVNIGAALAF
jgi:hypothetical protein